MVSSCLDVKIDVVVKLSLELESAVFQYASCPNSEFEVGTVNYKP